MIHFWEWRDRCGKWDVAKAQVNEQTGRGKAGAEYSNGSVLHLKGWVGLDTDVSLSNSSWYFKSIFGNIKALPTFAQQHDVREWGFQSLSPYGREEWKQGL
ncbi:hypothetical protein [Nostoc sp.]|uniref:hypothetical protein n=1 Tax=Nostoc sp. TaxID=1180 RepID=UPI002FFA0040